MSKKPSYYRKSRVLIHQSDSLLPKCIPAVGQATIRKAQKRQPHHRHENVYELCFIARGKVHWITSGEKHEITRGNVYIVKPNEIHGGVNMYMHPCKVYWLELTADSEYQQIKPFIEQLQHICFRYFPVDASVESLFNQIIQENQAPNAFGKELVYAKIIELLSVLCRAYNTFSEKKEKSAVEQSKKIEHAIAWIHSHLDEPFFIEDAAAQAGLKVSRFHQLFIKETGFSPLEFANRKRIELAKEKLIATSTSISDIAFPLGFNSTQYFATVFKKYCGLTPSAFRRKHSHR